jgi:predicted nucleotidyltransferase
MDAAVTDASTRGIGYPILRDRVYTDMFGEEEALLLRTPNNTLAAEYLRALSRQSRSIVPIAIPRTGDAHDTSHNGLPPEDAVVSASAIRACIRDGAFDHAMALLPPTTADCLTAAHDAGHLCTDPDSIPGAILLHTFRSTPPED